MITGTVVLIADHGVCVMVLLLLPVVILACFVDGDCLEIFCS